MEYNKLRVSVNDDLKLDIDNKALEQLDLIKIANDQYHLIHDNVNYKVELLKLDKEKKTVSLLLNGEKFDCKIADELDMLIEKMGLSVDKAKTVKSIHAPMPGKVLEVLVKKGQEFEEGESLLILEAMKMENVIKSPGKGKVTEIKISKGDAVEKGELLISL